jgi:hypothetical protein
MEKHTKQQAAVAASQAWHHLYESSVLRDVASFIQENHEEQEHEQIQNQIGILFSVAEDKAGDALDAITIVDNFFIEELKADAQKDIKSLRNTVKPKTENPAPVVFKQAMQAK